MSSRQEEKERRRKEREERERAEARKAAAKRRMQLVFGGVLAAAAIAAVVVAIASSGGDGGDGGGQQAGDGGPTEPIPAMQIADLQQAARAAGCEVRSFPSEGSNHIGDEESFDDYRTNPPTSGTHRVTPAQDGIYEPGGSPDVENWVHTLEHGRIIYQYAPGTPARRISQLETLVNEDFRGVSGYHQVLLENTTDMPYAVAAVAWTHYAGCKEFNDKVFDVFRAFREQYVDKAPEQVP